jgi:peroxin-19
MAEETGDLDAILDNALDQFVDELDEEQGDVNATVKQASMDTALKSTSDDKKMSGQGNDVIAESMAGLMDKMKDPEFASTLEDTFKKLASGGTPENPSDPFAALHQGGNPMDKSVASTLKMMSEASSDMEGMDTGSAEQMGEDIMKKMMGEFEKLGEKQDFQEIIDGMMRQLLSKEVMYEPMKEITKKFPKWLAENEDSLSKEDYERFGKMYQYFQKIVAVYESEPNNYTRLMELMQDMQECGQPPAEIVKELAPGLEFGPNGMPLMANMGPGVPMPAIPGMPAFPQGGGKPGECTVM